jgi:hypothetical protein
MRFFPRVLIFIIARNEKRRAFSSYSSYFSDNCVNAYVFQSFEKNLVISQHR